MTSDLLAPKTEITADLQIVRVLGTGGQGAVYEAVDRKTGVYHAIKLIYRRLLDDQTTIARLEREAQTASAIVHPNVIRIHGMERTKDGDLFLRMELLRGHPLNDVLALNPMPVPTACQLIRQTALGLAAAHRAGIIHRDVKPANVFLAETPDGVVPKIMDFGIAKASEAWDLTALTHTGGIIGTPAYMSPEQIMRPQEVDARTDIYSLGLIFYEALVGRRPFRGTEVAQIMMHQVQSMPPNPHRLKPEIPLAVAGIVMKCLAKSPSARFQSMEELIERLDAVGADPSPPTLQEEAGGLPPLEKPWSVERRAVVAPRSPPPPPPKRGWGRSIAVLVVLLSLGTGLALRFATEEAPVVDVPPPLPDLALPAVAVDTPIPAPPPDPPTNGKVRLSSEPAGAQVRANGELLGETPLTIELAAGHEHRLTLEKVGFASASVLTRVYPGEELARSVTLVPVMPAPAKAPLTARVRTIAPPPAASGSGYLSIDTTPWTKVSLDGQPLGSTPLFKVPIPSGHQRLRFINERAKVDAERTIELGSGETKKLRYTFE